LALSARRVDAHTACAWGLVDKVVERAGQKRAAQA
jgi:enoyl-CoA hydratase/carnithine racemase